MRRLRTQLVVGIDEVGRGALAGPVVVAALALPPTIRLPRTLGALRDSKLLTPAARERWAAWVQQEERIAYHITSTSPSVIDHRGIVRATNAAAARAYARVRGMLAGEQRAHIAILDGGLFIGSAVRQQRHYPEACTLVRADTAVAAVALASIVAKVYRDALMVRLERRLMRTTGHEYSMADHKGYGTRAHYRALHTYGPSVQHRLTFLRTQGRITSTTPPTHG